MFTQSRIRSASRQIQNSVVRRKIHGPRKVLNRARVIIHSGLGGGAKGKRSNIDRIKSQCAIKICDRRSKVSELTMAVATFNHRFDKIRFDADGLIKIVDGIAKSSGV